MSERYDYRILVNCEESGTLRDEFTKLGFDATSCDLFPSRTPGKHYQGDCFDILGDNWDLIISFPPCTHLALSGAKHFEKKRADGRQEAGIRFFFEVWKLSDVSENPMGILNGGAYIKKWFPELHEEMTAYGFPFKASQTVQPWQFGDNAQKTTCLWLKCLPPLYHNGTVNLFDSTVTHVGKGEFVTTPSGKKLPKWYSDNKSAKNRSKTFNGLAKAMATQWSDYLLNSDKTITQ